MRATTGKADGIVWQINGSLAGLGRLSALLRRSSADACLSDKR